MGKHYRVKVRYLAHGKPAEAQKTVWASSQSDAEAAAIAQVKIGKPSNQYWNYKAVVLWSSS